DILPDVLMGLKVALWLLFGAFAGLQLWKTVTEPLSMNHLILQWVALLACALFVASSLLHSWYMGALLPLAVLAHESWVGQALVAASAASLLISTPFRRNFFVFLAAAIFPFAFYGARHRKLRNGYCIRTVRRYSPEL